MVAATANCIPLSLYGKPDPVTNVPQKLIEILPKMTLDPGSWSEELKSMLSQPISASEMENVLRKDASQFWPKDVVMAYMWFFLSAIGCEGDKSLMEKMKGYGSGLRNKCKEKKTILRHTKCFERLTRVPFFVHLRS